MPGALPLMMTPTDKAALAKNRIPELPPVEYDHPTKAHVWIIDLDNDTDVRVKCNWPARSNPREPPLLGCALNVGHAWYIYVGPEDLIRYFGLTRNIVIRHEVGHINGWPADHPRSARRRILAL